MCWSRSLALVEAGVVRFPSLSSDLEPGDELGLPAEDSFALEGVAKLEMHLKHRSSAALEVHLLVCGLARWPAWLSANGLVALPTCAKRRG